MKKALLPLSVAIAALVVVGASKASAQYYDDYYGYYDDPYSESYAEPAPYRDPLCPEGYDCAWIDTRDVTDFGVTRSNGNGHGFQYDPDTQHRLCQISGYDRSIDGYNKTAKWDKCNNETHVEWRGYWYKYGCTSRTYLTNSYCIRQKPTSAPAISWSKSPSSAQCDAQYTVEARGTDADGDLVAVSVDKDGSPFAYNGGGDGSSETSGNSTSDQGPKTVTYTAWSTDSKGQRSPTITHKVSVGSCQAPNQEPQGTVDAANCDIVGGWAYDPDRPNDSIDVHFYVDGSFLTSATANGSRPDVNSAFGIGGNHGYTISTPSSIKNGATRSLQVYAIDASGGSNPVIGQSSVRCSSPAVQEPQPSGFITASPTSLPAGGGSVSISWAVASATSCSASGGWSGLKGTSGSQSASVDSTTTFSLSCSGPGGTWSDSVTVTVAEQGGSSQVCQDHGALNFNGSLPCRYPAAQCQDGSDNDGDGLIDMSDPGCDSASDNDEADRAGSGGDGSGGNGGGDRGGVAQPVPGFTVSADSSIAKVQFLGALGGVSEGRRIEANPVNGFSGPVTLRVAGARPKDGSSDDGVEILFSFDEGEFSADPSTSQSYNPSIGGGRYIGEQGLVGSLFRVSFSQAVKEPYEVVIEGVSGSLTAQYVLTIEPRIVNPSYQEI